MPELTDLSYVRASSPKRGALGSHINPAVLMGSNRIG